MEPSSGQGSEARAIALLHRFAHKRRFANEQSNRVTIEPTTESGGAGMQGVHASVPRSNSQGSVGGRSAGAAAGGRPASATKAGGPAAHYPGLFPAADARGGPSTPPIVGASGASYDMLEQGHTQYVTFMDYSVAFDSVSHKFPDETLREAGVLNKSRSVFRTMSSPAR